VLDFVRTHFLSIDVQKVTNTFRRSAPACCGLAQEPLPAYVLVSQNRPEVHRSNFAFVQMRLASADRPRGAICSMPFALSSSNAFSIDGISFE
jgi:hypothetical protein